MNYESIKTRIKTLIAEAQQKPASRIDAALEPIREDMLEARSQGVRVGELYKAIEAEAKNISPSSFAKYAQRHLQVKKQRRKRPAKPSAGKQVHVEKLTSQAKQKLPLVGQAAKPAKPLKHKDEIKIQEAPEQPRTQAGKPRIARGNY
jgi:hypothetical protein